MERPELLKLIPHTVREVDQSALPGRTVIRGKVRDMVAAGDRMVICATDRCSAFDRVLTTVPCKGQVLNQLALFWFDATRDIIPNHIEKKLSARTILARTCRVLPVEVVLRGYLTGSAWRDYQKGSPISGITLPPGMKPNQRFDAPLLTPSIKAESGSHDEPISPAEILKRGLVEPAVWKQVEDASRKLFARGTAMAAKNGLILVDTKYEFGLLDGQVVLVDEIHTPDSSRYWYADTYRTRFEAGENQRELDKEYLRRWLMERGFMGDGTAPDIPDEIRADVAERYITAYELITGTVFVPESMDAAAEARLMADSL